MKKFITTALLLLLVFTLVACSEESDGASTNDGSSNKASSSSKYPFPEDATETGDGQIVVNTPSGSSADGNVPVLITEPDLMMTQIGLDLSNFDGSMQTYIYVNEMFVDAQQVGELTQTTLDLQGDLLEPGTYTVSAIQFKNDDPKSGEVVSFTQTKYKVKKGS